MEMCYQICSRCIMDTSDPDIEFDQNGQCNHCRQFRSPTDTPQGVECGREQLEIIIEQVKVDGIGKTYDCVIGVSGGVDSTYVAYIVKKHGLRPLAVHLESRWDSDMALNNIQKAMRKLQIDLTTYPLDWEEFRDLHISLLKASVPEGDFPTDHAILPVLFAEAARVKTRYIIMGSNINTEGIMPKSWVYGHRDWKYLKSIQRQFGTVKLKSYPHLNYWNLVDYKLLRRQKVISILNCIPYSKKEAIQALETELDWEYYGSKHFESIYTRFFHGYILPRKFNIDFRRPYTAALICSREITREEGLAEMEKVVYPPEQVEADKKYILDSLALSETEFEQIMKLPVKTFWDYPSYHKHFLFKLARAFYNYNTR